MFVRAANVGGKNAFSTAALAKKLDLVNIGAAGTFVSRARVIAATIARELPFEADIAVRPGAEITALIDAGAKIPNGAQLFVCVLMATPKKNPPLPFDRPESGPWALRVLSRSGALVICARRLEVKRGLDLSAILEREFGVRGTTRSWSTMERVAAALAAL